MGDGAAGTPLKRRGSPIGDRARRGNRVGGRGGGDVGRGHGWRYPKRASRGDPRGGGLTLPEENADLPYFTPERVHLLLREVYGDFPHDNEGSHLDGGVADDALWQHRWHQLVAQSASWYVTPP